MPAAYTYISLLNVPTFTSLFLRYMCITLLLPLLLPLIYFICHSNISICAGQHSTADVQLSRCVGVVCVRRERTCERTNECLSYGDGECRMCVFAFVSGNFCCVCYCCCAVFFSFGFILVVSAESVFFLLKSMSVRMESRQIHVCTYLCVMLPISTAMKKIAKKQQHTYTS